VSPNVWARAGSLLRPLTRRQLSLLAIHSASKAAPEASRINNPETTGKTEASDRGKAAQFAGIQFAILARP